MNLFYKSVDVSRFDKCNFALYLLTGYSLEFVLLFNKLFIIVIYLQTIICCPVVRLTVDKGRQKSEYYKKPLNILALDPIITISSNTAFARTEKMIMPISFVYSV